MRRVEAEKRDVRVESLGPRRKESGVVAGNGQVGPGGLRAKRRDASAGGFRGDGGVFSPRRRERGREVEKRPARPGHLELFVAGAFGHERHERRAAPGGGGPVERPQRGLVRVLLGRPLLEDGKPEPEEDRLLRGSVEQSPAFVLDAEELREEA